MEGKSKVPMLILLAGIVILVLSLITDTLGIGKSPGFGYYQIPGIILGAILIIAGIFSARKK